MKNITIAIDDKMLAASREYAHAHHTSVNKLIRQLLGHTVMREATEDWADELFALADRASGDSKGKRWKREDLYDA